MPEKLVVDWDESLAAVKFKGHWRFFSDIGSAFILDYASWDPDWKPTSDQFRFGTLIVDADNAEQWMNSLVHEYTQEQLSNLYWKDSPDRVQLTFVVNVDEKKWIGHMWKMDQSPLNDFQPKGWTAIEDNVKNYLPDEILKYFE